MNAPVRLSAKVEAAANEAFAAGTMQDLLTEWSRLHLAMAMPRYSREVERAYLLTEWKLGKLYARLFHTGDPANVEQAADHLRCYFNHDPETDAAWDEGISVGPDGFDLAKDRLQFLSPRSASND